MSLCSGEIMNLHELYPHFYNIKLNVFMWGYFTKMIGVQFVFE